MDFKKKTKDELENRLQEIEEFIATKGIGAKALTKARRTQRNINLAIALGSVITLAGIVVWALSDHEE